MQELVQSQNAPKNMNTRREMVYKLFSNIISKQELGKVGAKEVEQILTIAEQAAARILQVK